MWANGLEVLLCHLLVTFFLVVAADGALPKVGRVSGGRSLFARCCRRRYKHIVHSFNLVLSDAPIVSPVPTILLVPSQRCWAIEAWDAPCTRSTPCASVAPIVVEVGIFISKHCVADVTLFLQQKNNSNFDYFLEENNRTDWIWTPPRPKKYSLVSPTKPATYDMK